MLILHSRAPRKLSCSGTGVGAVFEKRLTDRFSLLIQGWDRTSWSRAIRFCAALHHN